MSSSGFMNSNKQVALEYQQCEYQYCPLEASGLAYSRLTLPSYLERYHEDDTKIDACINFELGLSHELKVPLHQEEREGVLGFDIGELQKLINDQLGVTISDDLSSFSFMGKMNISELCLTQKLLSFHHGAIPSAEDVGVELQPPPLAITQSTSDEWVCSICLCILIDPITLQCGHTCCKECLQPILSPTTHHKRICPLCRDPIRPEWAIVIDAAMQRQIQDMFSRDQEYVERIQELQERDAERKGITVYKLPGHFLRKTNTAATGPATSTYPPMAIAQAAEARRLATEELRRVLHSVLLHLRPEGQTACGHSASAGAGGEGAEGGGGMLTKLQRYLLFHHSVTMMDFDSVQRGTHQRRRTTDSIATQVQQCLAAGQPFRALLPQRVAPASAAEGSVLRERVKQTLFPRVLHSMGMAGDPSFYTLCEHGLYSLPS